MKHRIALFLLGGLLTGICLTACSHDDETPVPQESPVPQFSSRAAAGDECTYIGINEEGTLEFCETAQFDETENKWVWSDKGGASTRVDWNAVSCFTIAYPAWQLSSVTDGAAILTQSNLTAYATEGLMLGTYPTSSTTGLSVHQQLALLKITWPETYAMNDELTLYLAGSATVKLYGTQSESNRSLLTVDETPKAYEYQLNGTESPIQLPIFPQTFAAGSVLFRYSTGSEATNDLKYHFFSIPEGADFTIAANQILQVKLKEKETDEETVSAEWTIGSIAPSVWAQGTSEDLTTE